MNEEKTRLADAGHDIHFVALPSGFRLGRYELLAVLGHGGFGITYRALDTELNRGVAIKEYLPSDVAVRVDGATVRAKSGRDEEGFTWGLERFLEEARALALFENANIVRVHDYMQANGTAYMVMALVEGEPLSALYRREAPLPEERLKAIVLPVLDGLEDVHQAGFLHRDIKPANILIRANGQPVLIDFGAARQALGEKSRSITSVFTPGYAPFEQYTSSGKQGPWTDIYALAATLYHGIAGKAPPQATDRIREDDMEPATTLGAGRYSRPFLAAIDAGLEVFENRRPQSVAQWRAMLTGEAPAPAAAAAAAAPARATGKKRLLLAAGIGALLLAGGGGYAAWQSAEAERIATAQRLQAEAEARQKAEVEAQARAEQQRRAAAEEARRKAEQEEKARAEAAARRQAEEAAARAAAEAKAREQAEARRQAEEEEKARAEAEARLRAELEAKIRADLEAQQKREAEIKRQAEEEARRKLEAEARARAEAERRAAEAERKARAAAPSPASATPAARPAAAAPTQQAAIAPPADPKRYVAENWDAMRASVERAMNTALLNNNRRVQTIDRFEGVSVTKSTVTVRVSATVTNISGMSRLDSRTMTVELRNHPPGFPAIGAR
ncbi:MAG: serine/threonine-protein kinase [Reyranellaceae bacterium]